MNTSGKLALSISVSAAAVAITIISLLSGLFGVAYAATSVGTVGGNVVVSAVCTISLTNTIIAFGGSSGVAPGTASSANQVLDTNDGNTQAWVWAYGGNWIGPSPQDNGNFFVTNTLYGEFGSSTPANALTLTSANTAIFLPAPSINAPTSNGIYFSVNVPVGVAAGTFQQAITITNTC